jgi:hypothetical protein
LVAWARAPFVDHFVPAKQKGRIQDVVGKRRVTLSRCDRQDQREFGVRLRVVSEEVVRLRVVSEEVGWLVQVAQRGQNSMQGRKFEDGHRIENAEKTMECPPPTVERQLLGSAESNRVWSRWCHGDLCRDYTAAEVRVEARAPDLVLEFVAPMGVLLLSTTWQYQVAAPGRDIDKGQA